MSCGLWLVMWLVTWHVACDMTCGLWHVTIWEGQIHEIPFTFYRSMTFKCLPEFWPHSSFILSPLFWVINNCPSFSPSTKAFLWKCTYHDWLLGQCHPYVHFYCSFMRAPDKDIAKKVDHITVCVQATILLPRKLSQNMTCYLLTRFITSFCRQFYHLKKAKC